MFEEFDIVITPFNRERKVRVYLPETYHQNELTRYPVLYMHDGQNLYRDEDASFGMSWRIADFLSTSEIELIVVGIDSHPDGMKRVDEYAPWTSEAVKKVIEVDREEIGGEGKEYIDFIVQELKPMIDGKYRTKPDETSMAGSSMGGLISTYAACMYPNIFKRVASVSSAFWVNQQEIEELIRNSDLSSVEKFYLDVGTEESSVKEDNERYVDSSQRVYDILREKMNDCQFKVVEGAEHNEKAWRDRVPEIFTYLYR